MFCSIIFMLKLNKPFITQEIFIISLFIIVNILVRRVKNLFLQILVDIFALGSGSVDLHIFTNPCPGSQNLTDQDTKHCY